MFNQIRRQSKAFTQIIQKAPLIQKNETQEIPTELKVPDGSFNGENIRIAGRRLIFLTLKHCLTLENEIVCFDISYDNDLLVSCSENILFIWNLKTLEIEQKIEIKLRNKRGEKEFVKITNCAISVDGKYIITIMPSKMAIWNRNTGKLSMLIELSIETHYIKFSDNGGEYLYVSGEDGIIRSWDWKAGKQTSLKLYHPASVRTFDFTHSDPSRFICGRVDGYCTTWDFEKKEVIDNIIPEPTWNEKKNEANRGGWINPESNHTGSILCLKIAPNKRLLATGSMDFTCKLWNIASYSKDTETVKNERLKEYIDFNGLIDITYPYEKERLGIRIGEVPICTGFHADVMFTYRHEAPVTILEFNRTSDILYTGSVDSTCRLWSTRKGELIFQINLPDHPQSLYVTPGLSNDMLYVTCQNRLLVFDVKAPTQEKDLPIYWRAGQELDSDQHFFGGNEFMGEIEKEKPPFEIDEDGNEIDKNDVTKINPKKGKYTFEEVRKLLSHGLIRDTYIKTMVEESNIKLPIKQLYSNIKKYNINITQVLRSIINDKYKPSDVIKALYSRNTKILKLFARIVNEGQSLDGVMSVLGYKKTTQEVLDNTYIFLSNEDIRPITTLELREMIKNDVFKYAFNQMFNNLSPDTIINDEDMIHNVLHFIPSKQIKLIKDFQKNELSNKIFMEDLDPKKSLPARYPNFKRSDVKHEVKSITPTNLNIGRMKRFDEYKAKSKTIPEKTQEPETEKDTEEPLEIDNSKYLPLNTKLGQLTKEQKRDLIDLYMDKLFGAGSNDKEWKSSGNILHYERYLQAKGLNIRWPYPAYKKKKRYPINDIRHSRLSHVYIQPILINQTKKNERELGLSQLIVGKKMEIQDKRPDLYYNNNMNNLRKVSKTYYTKEFNISDNSSIKVKSLQKLNKVDENKNNYSTYSTHNQSNYPQIINGGDNYLNIQQQQSNNKNFPTSIEKDKSKNNENSVINTNIRRLSNISTLYKTPSPKKNEEPKKLVFHNVMQINSFNDYKDDIEQIEKAILLSKNENISNINVNVNNIVNNDNNNIDENNDNNYTKVNDNNNDKDNQSLNNDDNQHLNTNSNNFTNNSLINEEVDDRLKEQRDILLANEFENEKKLDYHPFMNSTQKIGSEQKIIKFCNKIS
ncbi:WD40 repeat-like protein [Anaeromyces robustus]|uniref:WD40 repeat-like protein n=1 Tax=Anaeromyces robustus TaxID=1754192 RepID=A0A1Y1X8W8_9FUNG|nr:WD40 repeat-like protein [Anaeromyces robustus]|eukprot:ORX81866.1 WD40 repeat-like protein [Anaeromyces robustus]